MTGPADPPGEGVPPSIAAIMAAIRAEIAAPPVAAAAADEASDDASSGDEAGPAEEHLLADEDIDPTGHPPRTAADHAGGAGHFGDVRIETAPDAVPGHAATPAPAAAAAPSDRAAPYATDDDMIARGAVPVAPDPAPAPAPDTADVRAALAPLLKDWLDAHLPEIVEAAVHAEIRRLTGMTG